MSETPETLHRIRRAIRRALRRFESSRSDTPPYDASWLMSFRVVTEFDELDKVWVAECLDLPGCFSQGDTEAEAVANIHDAIKGVLVTRIEERFDAEIAEAVLENRRQRAPLPKGVQRQTIEVKVAVGA